jgi:hypothetical protein
MKDKIIYRTRYILFIIKLFNEYNEALFNIYKDAFVYIILLYFLEINKIYSLLSMDGNSDLVFQELIKKQIVTCKEVRKLTLHDIKRISKNLNTSIFNKDTCSLWGGYITNKNNNNKSKYINFYFRQRKVALHRLLYENYVSEIRNNQYIKYTCDNKGFCCNINHMYILDNDTTVQNITEPNILTVNNDKGSKDNLTVNFD